MYADPDPECDDDAVGTARAVAVPVAATTAAFAAYVGLYGLDSYLGYADLLGPRGEWVQFLVMAGVVAAHGAVHAAGYAVLGGGSRRDVTVDFEAFPGGFEPVRVAVSPGGPIRRSAYLAGLVAPGVVLGVVPVAWALASGNPLAMFVGAVGLLVSGSDVSGVIDVVRAADSSRSLAVTSTAPDGER
ncbi:metalloprotease family protein [Halosimplex marinum]|uniref:metalloprotease family protein n=1 Tax=Halosimplex marinum TaxID=3396620 RepID=UPI003F56878F